MAIAIYFADFIAQLLLGSRFDRCCLLVSLVNYVAELIRVCLLVRLGLINRHFVYWCMSVPFESNLSAEYDTIPL